MRRVVVLTEAAEDIEQARDFYDLQEKGIGDTALIHWSPISKVWPSTTEFIPAISVFIACSPTDFRLAFIIVKRKPKPKCLPCWIYEENLIGFAKN